MFTFGNIRQLAPQKQLAFIRYSPKVHTKATYIFVFQSNLSLSSACEYVLPLNEDSIYEIDLNILFKISSVGLGDYTSSPLSDKNQTISMEKDIRTSPRAIFKKQNKRIIMPLKSPVRVLKTPLSPTPDFTIESLPAQLQFNWFGIKR